MRPQFSILLAILILFVKPAAAQIYPPVPGDFKVTAPFDFVAEKQALPSGNYIVHWEKASNRLQICEEGVSCETVQAVAIKAPKTPAQPKVIFSRYGDKHFLRQIWLADGTGFEFSACPLESETDSTVKAEAVYLDADLLCFHTSKGLPPSWHYESEFSWFMPSATTDEKGESPPWIRRGAAAQHAAAGVVRSRRRSTAHQPPPPWPLARHPLLN